MTWERLLTAGSETSACQWDRSAPLPVLPPPLLSAWPARLSATVEYLMTAAGWEITVWLREPSAPLSATLPLLLSVQKPLTSGDKKKVI